MPIDNNLDNRPSQVRNEEENDLLNLADLWSMIWDNKWWYVLSVAICLCFSVFYLYRTASSYTRTAKVMIDDTNENSALRDLASFTGGVRYRNMSGSNVYNEIEAISSPDIMQTVVKRLGLETSYVEKQFLRSREKFTDSPIEKISGRLRDTVSTPVGKIVIVPTEFIDKWKKPMRVSWVNSAKLAKAYCKGVTVALSGKESTVIVLTMKDRFPSRADAVLRTLIDVYNEHWVENKNRSARNTTAFINDRLIVIEKELGGVEENLKDYKSSHKITDIRSLSAAYLEESTEYKAKSFDVNNQRQVHQGISGESCTFRCAYPCKFRIDQHDCRGADQGVQQLGTQS